MKDLKKAELVELAKKYKIKGYSKMTKQQLIEAVSLPETKTDSVKLIEKSGAGAKAESSNMRPVSKGPRPMDPVAQYYDQDMIFMLPCEPDRQYVCWEISKYTQNKVKSEFGDGAILVRLMSSEGKELAKQGVDSIGSWYFGVYSPFETVWAEIGLLDSNGIFHIIMRSLSVVLPSDRVSSVTDAKWMLVGSNWKEVLGLSGVFEEMISVDSSLPGRIIRKINENLSSKQGGLR